MMKRIQFTQDENQHKYLWILASIQIILPVLMIPFVFVLDKLNVNESVIVALDLAGMVLLILYSGSILESQNIQKLAVVFLTMMFFESVYLFSDALFYFLNETPSYYLFNLIDNTIYVICPIVMVMLFWDCLTIWLGEIKQHRYLNKILNFVALAQLAFYILNVFFGFAFRISKETGIYQRGPLYGMTILFPLIMLVLCIYRVWSSSNNPSNKIRLSMYPLAPFIGTILQFALKVPLVAITTFFSVTYLYTHFYVEREIDIHYLENKLTESHLRTLQMQINPHFLYNTLTTMASLCDSNPEAAKEMIYQLSEYLRSNYTDIERPSMIPFQEELEQLKKYVAIEHVRFPNITVNYELKALDFSLPSMSLQPLVENAINHGIRKQKKSRGTITIFSYEEGNAWLVAVKDDGVGYDVNRTHNINLLKGHRKHYGMQNVRTRLQMMCKGTMEVESAVGKGTTVTLHIPKQK